MAAVRLVDDDVMTLRRSVSNGGRSPRRVLPLCGRTLQGGEVDAAGGAVGQFVSRSWSRVPILTGDSPSSRTG